MIFFMKKLFFILAGCLLMGMVSCSKDEPMEEGPGSVVSPDANVPDPAGTISLSMWNGDETSLDGLKIGNDNNFHGSYFYIADIGQVRGLGNVAYIPAVGWSDKVAVIPGHGYVAVDTSWGEPRYYRIYVEDTVVSTSGGIIGFDIKYQKPFNGLDEAISVSEGNVVIGAEGGSVDIMFGNSTIIPFTVESSESWCEVRRASTTPFRFLYDSILIICQESHSPNPTVATVTITTANGKKTEIQVSQQSYGPYLSLASDFMGFSFDANNSQTQYKTLYTNLPLNEIETECSENWIIATVVEDRTRAIRGSRRIQWVEGEEKTRAGVPSDMTSYYLKVTVPPYREIDSREGTVTVKTGNLKETLTVKQYGNNIMFYPTDLKFGADTDLSQRVSWNGSSSRLTYEIEGDGAEWCHLSFAGYDVVITVDPNYYPQSRHTVINLYYNFSQNGTPSQTYIGSINVEQEGMNLTNQYLYFDKNSSNTTIGFGVSENARITSSASWCSATRSGGSLVIRVTATTENRSAVISVEGVDAKIYVSQSKYAVGDTYSEDGLEAPIASMENGVGTIYKYYVEYYGISPSNIIQWSNEKVANPGARSETDGVANCNAIKAIPNWEELYPALNYVEENWNVDGITGWYIPARQELLDLNPLKLLSQFQYKDIFFWSSTEKDANDEYGYNYYGSYRDTSKSKTNTGCVIAIHKFSYDFNK